MPHCAALVLAVALLALPARAELVEIDLNAPGDGLVTRDTETGLDWLDVGGVTTGLSYDAVMAGAGGWITSGWRYATQAEICGLFVDHTEATACTFDSGIISWPTDAANLITLLGSTGSTFGGTEISTFTSGLYDDGTGGAAGEAKVEVFSTFPPSGIFLLRTRATPDLVPSGTASSTRGSFLVRATPPAVPALPTGGIAVITALLLLEAWRRRGDTPYSRRRAG